MAKGTKQQTSKAAKGKKKQAAKGKGKQAPKGKGKQAAKGKEKQTYKAVEGRRERALREATLAEVGLLAIERPAFWEALLDNSSEALRREGLQLTPDDLGTLQELLRTKAMTVKVPDLRVVMDALHARREAVWPHGWIR